MRTRWVTYKHYSGYVVDGGPPVQLPESHMHLHIMRAVWLASRLEAPRYGSVQGYDGAGMSGGLLHNIAVMPQSMEQGSFFELLSRVMTASPSDAADVKLSLAQKGWHVAPDGWLRDSTGAKVSAQNIRNEFSGPDGKVPRAGSDRQRAWAEMFHRLFAAPGTHLAQMSYAAEWLARGNSKAESEVYRYYARLDSVVSLPSAQLPPEVDLAMCVYHSFSVNAPGIASACLSSPVAEDSKRFAKKVIRALGKRKYARWTDEPGDGGNRYDKTRTAVWECGLWPQDLARELMPRDL